MLLQLTIWLSIAIIEVTATALGITPGIASRSLPDDTLLAVLYSDNGCKGNTYSLTVAEYKKLCASDKECATFANGSFRSVIIKHFGDSKPAISKQTGCDQISEVSRTDCVYYNDGHSIDGISFVNVV